MQTPHPTTALTDLKQNVLRPTKKWVPSMTVDGEAQLANLQYALVNTPHDIGHSVQMIIIAACVAIASATGAFALQTTWLNMNVNMAPIAHSCGKC